MTSRRTRSGERRRRPEISRPVSRLSSQLLHHRRRRRRRRKNIIITPGRDRRQFPRINFVRTAGKRPWYCLSWRPFTTIGDCSLRPPRDSSPVAKGSPRGLYCPLREITPETDRKMRRQLRCSSRFSSRPLSSRDIQFFKFARRHLNAARFTCLALSDGVPARTNWSLPGVITPRYDTSLKRY